MSRSGSGSMNGNDPGSFLPKNPNVNQPNIIGPDGKAYKWMVCGWYVWEDNKMPNGTLGKWYPVQFSQNNEGESAAIAQTGNTDEKDDAEGQVRENNKDFDTVVNNKKNNDSNGNNESGPIKEKKDDVRYAPSGNSYIYPIPENSSTTYCNIYVNNQAIKDGYLPDTDSLINQWPCYSFLEYIYPPYAATTTKTPIPGTVGYVYFWWHGKKHQPQHVEYYRYDNEGFVVYEGWGQWYKPPVPSPRNPNNYLDFCKNDRDKDIIDILFIPLSPTN